MTTVPPRYEIRADFDDETIVVYQAYRPDIGLVAARDGRFGPGWKRDRMTWVKPSFRWMMYRCGWATKPDQETVLAIRMSRAGFETALRHACLSSYSPTVHESRDAWQTALRTSTARAQWDPERDLHSAPLTHRSLQLGLSGLDAAAFVDEWVRSIDDVTGRARRIKGLVDAGRMDDAAAALPVERSYPGQPDLIAHLVAPADVN